MDGAIIVCSGGLDSVTAAYTVRSKNPTAKLVLLFVDYAQRSKEEELFCAKKQAEFLGAEFIQVDMSWLGALSASLINSEEKVPKKVMNDLENVELEQKDVAIWWVPFRNTLLVSAAVAHAESIFLKTKERFSIVVGIKKEGQISFKDSRPEFVAAMNALAEEGTFHGGFEVIAPLIELDKDEVVALGTSLNIPYEFTLSCYAPKGFKENLPVHCGVCSACRQRQAAFYWSGKKDPSLYEVPFEA